MTHAAPPTGPADLLATWEAGLAQHDRGRSLLLHRAARPGAGADELLSMPVGEREADLFALRRALFGERMQVRVECASCGEAMEFDLDATLLGARTRTPAGPLRVEEGEWVVEFRLPTVADLAAAGTAPDPVEARRLLLARCTVSAARGGAAVAPEQLAGALPERVAQRLAEMAEESDPAADVTLNVACPECGEATPAELDITSYLWTELDNWARDLMLDVHLLATAYGWSEPEILALSPLRRRYYLELCADG
ncbi:T4 family baseplate hub assembly chaperone [Streptomyces sp. NPDC054841]